MTNTTDLVSEIEGLTVLLGGTVSRSTTYDSTGRTSKKITIEYDIKEKKKNNVES
tara:strand:- start:172 stop:336 length:165 start_codon:yes stop_codon:yes gene_type:complete